MQGTALRQMLQDLGAGAGWTLQLERAGLEGGSTILADVRVFPVRSLFLDGCIDGWVIWDPDQETTKLARLIAGAAELHHDARSPPWYIP